MACRLVATSPGDALRFVFAMSVGHDAIRREEVDAPARRVDALDANAHLVAQADRRAGALAEEDRPLLVELPPVAAQLASLGVATPPLPEAMSPSQAADAVAEMSRLVDEHVRRTGHGRRGLTTLVLRTLKQAYYSPRNVGHAGLSLARYCHFTSPIRRYPDLVCHRALLSTLDGSEPAPRAAQLGELGEWTSAREREAMMIERDADDVARCFLLESRLRRGEVPEAIDGEVVGLVGSGLFVSFGEVFEGMLPVRRLRGDWWELNEQGTIMRAVHSGDAIRLGDPVRVTVGRVEAARGRVDLYPA